MSIRLLIIPIPNNLKISKDIAAELAFEAATRQWKLNPAKVTYIPVVMGDLCTLYSYSPPNCHSHVTPWQVWRRMQHTIRKDSIYMTVDGDVYMPGIERKIGITLHNKNFVKKEYQNPLRGASCCKSFGLVWDSILWISKMANSVIRNFYGEKILDFFCAEDRSFYGSLHTKNDSVFVSVHGHTKENILRGIGILNTILFVNRY